MNIRKKAAVPFRVAPLFAEKEGLSHRMIGQPLAGHVLQLPRKEKAMELHFEPIIPSNREQVLELKTAAGQEGYVESVAECLAEADKRSCWRPVGIYDGELLVGFAMYGFFWEYLPFGHVWLDRLMIDGRYQGQGYGKAALKGLLARLYKEYGRRKIYLSVIDGNNTAIDLYKSFGFRFNGRKDLHGERIMVCRF